jgi:membrane-associated protease RseP (regulator of RpoE activity)
MGLVVHQLLGILLLIVIWSVIVLFLIFVHELGHALALRAIGFQLEEPISKTLFG